MTNWIKQTLIAVLLTGLVNSYGIAQPKNIALHKPVWTSSLDKQFSPQYITDGKISRDSKWQAGTTRAPHIIEIDLQQYYDVTGMVVHSGIKDDEKKADEETQAAGFWSVKNFKLQYWDDANWTDLPRAEVHENRLVQAPFDFNPAITTSKIRMICDDGEAINIMEIEIFGDLTPNMPPPPTSTGTIKKEDSNHESKEINVTIDPRVVGKSMKYVGYNQGYYFPGSNVSGWLAYSQVNSLRVWTSLNAFVPDTAVEIDSNVVDVEDFERRKAELRRSPEKNRFIRWDVLTPLYDRPDSSSTNAMIFNYALHEAKRLGMDVVLQLGSRDFSDSWENKWKQWQRYYAIAYYAAKTGDVVMFAMQNEPNHRHSGPMLLDQWIAGSKIVSDAIDCAIEDVNVIYGKKLQAKFVGPVTAGHNTDWWAAISRANRTDYHGKSVEREQVDLFSTHSYNSPATGYEHRIANIHKILADNHPQGKSLPVLYTEIGRWMNAYLIDKEETMDSPSLFTEWAGIYSNNMKNGGYGMWAFKFANTASSTYPRGIKSGHHFIWQGKRIVEDAYTNLAYQKAVKASSAMTNAAEVTDGNKDDNSAWISTDETEKWLEIDLGTEQAIGSAVVYTGSAGGVYTSPDRIKNFKLQYLANNTWKDIPGATEKNGRYAQVFTVFKSPVKTRKVRFVSSDEGNLKVREIKLFAQGDGPSDQADYNVSGIQRTGEVVRLFAKGFKDERPLLETTTPLSDSDLDTYTSFDEKSGNYYIWLVLRNTVAYNLNIDLNKLGITPKTPITVETVDHVYHGEVTHMGYANDEGKFSLVLPPQSVMLLTIPKQAVDTPTVMDAQATAMVRGDTNAHQIYRNETELKVQLDAATPSNNQVSYIHFDITKDKLRDLKKGILEVTGQVNKDQRAYRLHVYAIPNNDGIDNTKYNWNNALLLDSKEALIQQVGEKAFVAGQMVFDLQKRKHYLDVTDILAKHLDRGVTFVFVRETRQLGDDEDKGRQVSIQAQGGNNGPKLHLWP